MNFVPAQRAIVRFDHSYKGTFGRFQTDASYSVQYLLTSLSIDDIGDLATAAEVLDLDSIQFDELIQRDVDKQRVREIAELYLRAGRNRPVFFPPLIACVALFDNSAAGRLKNQYEVIERARLDDNGYETLVTTFDRDGFRLVLPVATAEFSDRTIEWDGAQTHYYDYAAELAINSRRTKLVVLDGQHRLEALRTLLHTPENRQIISSIELPICIVWPPEARVGQAEETVVADFRELFVRINSSAQRVSGHFITLLNDRVYSAMTVRELANAWKHERDGGWSRLHLLEWNTREDASTDRRTRPFSITTISIVFKVLEEYLFKVSGLPAKLLDLQAHRDAFQELDPEFQESELGDDRQSPAITEIIREQICSTVVPALYELLRKLRPYADQEQRLDDAFRRSQREATELNMAHTGLNQQLSKFIYIVDDRASGQVTGAYADFREWARNPDDDGTYFFAVFQQALLRMWLRLAAVHESIGAIDAAKATVSALNACAVRVASRQHDAFLSPDLSYCRRVLWKGEAVNFSAEWARKAWLDILTSTLLLPNVRTAALDELNANAEVRRAYEETLVDMGLVAARAYADRLWEVTLRDTRNNLGDYFGEVEAGRLREEKQTNMKAFENAVSENAQVRYRAAVTLLANRLGRRSADLLRSP